MARLITSIVLLCLCLVTTSEITARASRLLPSTGVAKARACVVTSLSVVEVTEDSENSDQQIPVVSDIIACQSERTAPHTAAPHRVATVLHTSDAPLYIAIRRLLI